MYSEIIERRIIDAMNKEKNHTATDIGFIILPENEREEELLHEFMYPYFPDPEPDQDGMCEVFQSSTEEKSFDPNIG